ncbi:MAG: alpha/beta hydrolase fold domain-containing protein [Chitinivibrionales bacterium]|nr:alpha/beta hydrolase fold domain-containing protein [Chitinivibrionales bacterium]MBD3396655.1 alpha/beta hydrolase fold domain-containing protein [Chitinivibrionales bacterium]
MDFLAELCIATKARRHELIQKAKVGEGVSKLYMYDRNAKRVSLALVVVAHTIIVAQDNGPRCYQYWPLPDAQVYRTFGSESIELNVYKPEGWKQSDTRPCIVQFFGGGFYKNCIEAFGPLRDFCVDSGFVVIMAEYRLASCEDDQTTPIKTIEDYCMPDAKSAIRWTRENAGDLGINPDRIIAMGASAGGHLAATAAIVNGYENDGEDVSVSSVPNMLIMLWPVLDITIGEGARFKRFTHSAYDISPARHVHENTPPTLICVGSEDQFYDGDQVFINNANEYSFPLTVRVYEGGPHDFGFRTDMRWHNRGEDSVVVWTFAFLEEHGFMPNQHTSVQARKNSRSLRCNDREVRQAFQLFDLRGRSIPSAYRTDGRHLGSSHVVIYPKAQRPHGYLACGIIVPLP